MTLTITETGLRHKCTNCKVKTIAVEHNGMLVIRAGKQSVMVQSASITCPGCGHWNHISLRDKPR